MKIAFLILCSTLEWRLRMKNRLKRLNLILLVMIMSFVSISNVAYAEEVSEQTESSEVKVELKYPTQPTVSAGAAILMDADTGAILYEKDA